MYVCLTPFELAEGLENEHTLILPSEMEVPDDFIAVGELSRKEAKTLIKSYSFDLQKTR